MAHSQHIIKRLHDQRGVVAILFVLLLPVLLGFAALTIDMTRLNLARIELQNAADAAALAGTLSLHDTGGDPYNWTAAENKAMELAHSNKANGSLIPANNVQIQTGYWNLQSRDWTDVSPSYTPVTGDFPAVRVTIAHSLNLFFAPILGINERNVQASAVAILKLKNKKRPIDYAIFSGSTTKQLNMNGSGFNITGSVHTNEKLRINGSSITITEAAEAVGTVTTNGSGINIGERLPDASVIDMPDYSEAIAEAAAAAHQTYNSSYTINGGHITSDPIYVQGNNHTITVNGSGFTATGAVMGDGNITINGSGMASGDSQVCFYSKNGDITLNGSNYTLNGVLYAPNGKITINGSNVTINGSVVGNEVRINGSSFTVDRTNHPITSLPVDPPEIHAVLVN
jgi:Flp pilus assembly protein TadG/cytoskeletal protein CcmA (bactofilin family)